VVGGEWWGQGRYMIFVRVGELERDPKKNIGGKEKKPGA